MEETKQVRIKMSAVTAEFLEEYRERERLSGIGPAIDHIIHDYQEMIKKQWDLNYVSRSVSKQIEQELTTFWEKQITKSLSPLRKSVQQTDLQTQVLIELVQALMQTESIEDIIPTTEYRPSFLETAETAVKQRIDQRKQYKHSAQERMNHK
ncbi:TPA_asm: hypothetical protein G2720_24420 [Salmonella enterica subsp. enterica serovar Enteritidis str. P125109]|uniref:Uncharacterized protein n=1 Tax=Salmonella enteritidis PT4 (strain P125109) TaxID=550537 RepID=A0A724WNV8_SALEP|nr:hypothetical protein [Salmonella enterica subsp. enterica serovar Enteritidis str. P125109]